MQKAPQRCAQMSLSMQATPQSSHGHSHLLLPAPSTREQCAEHLLPNCALAHASTSRASTMLTPVSYTHLRAHETSAHL
eukprot:909912-Alexandrium_andersonii.AAC.1